MKKKTIQRLAAAVTVSLALAATALSTQANHAWSSYHWARTTPQFTLKLGDNLTAADWKSHLTRTAGDWNAGNSAVLTAVVAGSSNRRCAMVAGTTQVCNSKYGSNGWLGLASINITGGVHITQGTAKMNDTYFSTATYNNPNEKLHVMCQEIAHTFGLDHQSTDGSSQNSCMDYFSNTGVNAGSTLSTKPNAHDFQELNLIYAHLDSTSTVNGATAASLADTAAADSTYVDVTDDANSWGQLTRQSAGGRSSVYERHNSDGSKTVTHVYWTLEAAAKCASCDHRYTR